MATLDIILSYILLCLMVLLIGVDVISLVIVTVLMMIKAIKEWREDYGK